MIDALTGWDVWLSMLFCYGIGFGVGIKLRLAREMRDAAR